METVWISRDGCMKAELPNGYCAVRAKKRIFRSPEFRWRTFVIGAGYTEGKCKTMGEAMMFAETFYGLLNRVREPPR